MNTPLDPPNGPDSIILSVILPAEIADALDQAAGENLSSRASCARRLIAAGLRETGHLAPLPTRRRPRT